MAEKKLVFEDAFKVERKTLGDTIPVSVFRLLRIVALPNALGESAGPMLYTAGKAIGAELLVKTPGEFLKLVQDTKIGIPKILEQSDTKIVVQVDECISCAGLPNVGQFVCNFEGGIIAGALEKLLGKKVKATEVKCWANGDKTCVFDCIIY